MESLATPPFVEGCERALDADGLCDEHREEVVGSVPKHSRHKQGQPLFFFGLSFFDGK